MRAGDGHTQAKPEGMPHWLRTHVGGSRACGGARRPSVSLEGGLRLKQVVRASDGTRKLVFEITEGDARGGSVETVLIPVVRQRGLRDRLTICVSSQVRACVYVVCAPPARGWTRGREGVAPG